jgi:hypothetical protein
MRDRRIYMYREWVFCGWRSWVFGVDVDKDIDICLGPWIYRIVCD